MAQFYDMLIFLRKRSGLSQQELADATGLKRSAISMYETGKREPDLETLELFADFFNVDMNTLTGQKNSPAELQLSEGEAMLIQLFRKVPEDKQRIVLEMIKAALNSG